MKSSPRKSYCKNISGVVARCLWKWRVWVPPKLAGSAIQMDRFYNTWACSWTTTPGPNKWDLGASRLWRMQSDLFQSQSYRVPKFISTLPARPDIYIKQVYVFCSDFFSPFFYFLGIDMFHQRTFGSSPGICFVAFFLFFKECVA